MPTHIDTTFVRYACNCVVDPDGWRPRDTEPNGNTRDLDRTVLRAEVSRTTPREAVVGKRVADDLAAARKRGVRGADFDAMAIAKVAQKDEQGKDVLVWSAPPGRCPAHNAPVVLSASYDYIAPDVALDELSASGIDEVKRL